MAGPTDNDISGERRTSAQLVQWMRVSINAVTAGHNDRASRRANKRALLKALESVDPSFNELWLKRALGHRADRRPAPVPIDVVEAIGSRAGTDLETGRTLWHQAADEPGRRPRRATPPRMRGRDDEWRTASSLVESVQRRGDSATLLVVADAGFGKTMFIEALAAQAVAQHATVVPIDLSLPGLGAFEEALGIASPSTATRTALAPAEIRELVGIREATIEESLYATAKRGLSVVLLDDLHRADASVRGLLGRFARRSLPVPLLTVVTSRPRPDPAGVLTAIRSEAGTVTTIDLGPLDEPAVADMIADRAIGLAQPLQREVARRVIGVTGGDPAGTALLLDGAFDGTTWRSGYSPDSIGSEAPRTTLDRWSERLDPLAAEVRTTIEAAAVVGLHSDIRLLRQLPHLASCRERVAASVAAAVESGVLRWRTEQDPLVATFAHDYARDAVLANLVRPVQFELHHQIADVLETPLGALVEPDDYQRTSSVAAHRLACIDAYPGDPALATSVISYAAQALARAEVDPALRAIRIALGQAPLSTGARHRRLRASLLQLYASGPIGWADREQALLEAIDLVDGEEIEDIELAATLACDLSHLSLYGQPGPTITDVLEQSTRRFNDELPALRAQVTARLASHLIWSAGPDPTLALSDDLSQHAVSLARSSDDATAIAVALEARAVVLAGLPDVDAMVETATELRAVGPPSWIEFVAHIRRADRRALDHATADFERADELALWYRQAYCHQLRCLLAFAAGDLAGGLAEAGAVTAGYEDGDADFEHGQGAALIWERHLAGDGPTARGLLEIAVAQFPEVDSYRAALASFELAPGCDPTRAETMAIDLLERGLGAWRHQHSQLPGLAFLAEVIADLGLREHAAPVREALLPFAGQLVVLGPGTLCLGATDRFIAMLTPLATGDVDDARQTFEAAEATEDAFGAVGLAATTVYWHGRIVAEHGDLEHAAVLLADAADQVPAPMAGLAAAIARHRRSLRRRSRGQPADGSQRGRFAPGTTS